MSDQSMAPRAEPKPTPDPIEFSTDPFRRLMQQFVHPESGTDDLVDGQIVIVAARWVLVAAGLGLALWNPVSIGPLRVQVLVLLLIAVGNFFLHAQLLRRHDALHGVAYGASAADLTVISLLVASQHGYESHLFAFYFPAVLALSVAFRPALTALYAGTTMAVYALICFESLGRSISSDNMQTIFVRLLTIGAVAFCGALYQSVETCRSERDEFPDDLFPEIEPPIETAA